MLTAGVRLVRAFATSAVRNKRPIHRAPAIPESEIEEKFVRGRGPGGQKINKTSIVAQLKHIPTGIMVTCQDTRSREDNRRIGRVRLAEKVEFEQRGDESRLGLVHAKLRAQTRNRRRKSVAKYRKLADSARSDDDGNDEEK